MFFKIDTVTIFELLKLRKMWIYLFFSLFMFCQTFQSLTQSNLPKVQILMFLNNSVWQFTKVLMWFSKNLPFWSLAKKKSLSIWGKFQFYFPHTGVCLLRAFCAGFESWRFAVGISCCVLQVAVARCPFFFFLKLEWPLVVRLGWPSF